MSSQLCPLPGGQTLLAAKTRVRATGATARRAFAGPALPRCRKQALMRGKEKTSMPVEDVIIVSVPVTDQGRALAFYVGTLGLKLARVDETMLGIRRIQVTGNGTTCLSLVTWCESMPPGCLRGLALRSSDLAADYQRLVAAGVEFDGPPFAGPDGTCQAVCYDPDGNALVLQSDSTERVTREPRKAARAPQAPPDAAVPGEPVAAESGAKADPVTKLRPPAA